MQKIFIVGKIVGALRATPLLSPDNNILKNETMSSISPKSGSLSVVVRSYKSAVTRHVHIFNIDFAWQARFYDSIICTSGQLSHIRKYIWNNPQTWNNNKQNRYPK
jgi:hypothetical protein